VLRLEEQGKLKTTDSIGRHLAGVPPDKVPITIEHLLGHTAGLAGPRLTRGIDPSDREAVVSALLAPERLEKPGEVPRYNNVNYFLLAAIVERASGMPIEAYVRDHIFLPAGLKHTDFARGGGAPATRGAAHGYTLEGLDAGAAGTQPYHWLFRGATGVLSTVEDLGRWARALKGDDVLGVASREKMLRRGLGGYGFGWEIGRGLRGMLSFSLDGSTPSFESVFVCFPEQQGLIVLLCNNRGVAYHVKLDFLAAFVGDPYSAPPPTIRIDPMGLRAYAGVYERPGISKPLRFTVVGEELDTDFAQPARARFVPETETRFVTYDWATGKSYHVEFHRAVDGSIDKATLLDLGEDLEFKRRPSR
jgi:CubicO group peptidase (beta-lactamase class C family)